MNLIEKISKIKGGIHILQMAIEQKSDLDTLTCANGITIQQVIDEIQNLCEELKGMVIR